MFDDNTDDPQPQSPTEWLAQQRQKAPKPAITPAIQKASDLAEQNGFTVTSTTGGKHNVGSKHPSGQAVDLRTKDQSPESVDDMIGKYANLGYRVLDERQRPSGQQVWGGQHVHVEETPSSRAIANAQSPSEWLAQQKAQAPAPSTPNNDLLNRAAGPIATRTLLTDATSPAGTTQPERFSKTLHSERAGPPLAGVGKTLYREPAGPQVNGVGAPAESPVRAARFARPKPQVAPQPEWNPNYAPGPTREELQQVRSDIAGEEAAKIAQRAAIQGMPLTTQMGVEFGVPFAKSAANLTVPTVANALEAAGRYNPVSNMLETAGVDTSGHPLRQAAQGIRSDFEGRMQGLQQLEESLPTDPASRALQMGGTIAGTIPAYEVASLVPGGQTALNFASQDWRDPKQAAKAGLINTALMATGGKASEMSQKLGQAIANKTGNEFLGSAANAIARTAGNAGAAMGLTAAGNLIEGKPITSKEMYDQAMMGAAFANLSSPKITKARQPVAYQNGTEIIPIDVAKAASESAAQPAPTAPVAPEAPEAAKPATIIPEGISPGFSSVPVQGSGNLSQIGYDPASQRMRVRFASGQVYEYNKVAPEDYQKLQTSAQDPNHSTGNLFNVMKAKWPDYQKVGTPEKAPAPEGSGFISLEDALKAKQAPPQAPAEAPKPAAPDEMDAIMARQQGQPAPAPTPPTTPAPDLGTSANPNITPEMRAQREAQMRARQEQATAPKPTATSKVEILGPDDPLDVPDGYRLREFKIDGQEVVVRVPKGIDKETAQIIAKRQLRQKGQNAAAEVPAQPSELPFERPAVPAPALESPKSETTPVQTQATVETPKPASPVEVKPAETPASESKQPLSQEPKSYLPDLQEIYGVADHPSFPGIERRLNARQGIKDTGKFHALSFRGFPDAEGNKLYSLAEHPEVRKMMDLPEMPNYENNGPAYAQAAQHTMDALAEAAGLSRSSEAHGADTLKMQRYLQAQGASDSVMASFHATRLATNRYFQNVRTLFEHPEVDRLLDPIAKAMDEGRPVDRGDTKKLMAAVKSVAEEINKNAGPYEQIAPTSIAKLSADLNKGRFEGEPSGSLVRAFGAIRRSRGQAAQGEEPSPRQGQTAQGVTGREARAESPVQAEPPKADTGRFAREPKPVDTAVAANRPEPNIPAAVPTRPEPTGQRGITETVSHPNPEIDGKPIVARTAEGKVVVPNDANKSGVSIVTPQEKGAEKDNSSSPESIAQSLSAAQKQIDARNKEYREATAQLPDGTKIGGWGKQTIAGDVFWVKGKRQTVNVLVEAGQKAVDAALEANKELLTFESKRKTGTDDMPPDLLTEIRRAGGMKQSEQMSGELRRISQKETGTTGLINKNSRFTPDELRAQMVSEGVTNAETVDDFLQEIEGHLRDKREKGSSYKTSLDKQYEEHVNSQMSPGERADSAALEAGIRDSKTFADAFDRISDNGKEPTAQEVSDFKRQAVDAGISEEGASKIVDDWAGFRDRARQSGDVNSPAPSVSDQKPAQTVDLPKPDWVTEKPAKGAKPTSRFSRNANPDIQDFGEKIGGARKDTAVPLGPKRKTAAEEDTRPSWEKKYSIGEIATGPDKGKFSVHRDDGSTGVRRSFRGYNDPKFDTRAEAEAAIPLLEVNRKHRVGVDRVEGQPDSYYIYRKVADGKYPRVKEGFASRTEAEAYIAEHPKEIIEHKFPDIDKARPWLDKITREGTSRREGDVSTKQFQDDFGFRGGEFGNWNKGGDGQQALNHAYDGLHDLSETLGISPRALSLNGELAIAFGARGHGLQGARAHYEPDKAVINLTKIHGAGALSHEWFHALDHFVGRTEAGIESYAADKQGRFATEGFSHKTKAEQALVDAWKNIVNTITAKHLDVPIEYADAARNAAHQSENVNEHLTRLKQDFERDDSRYNKRWKAPTTEQKARWDALAEKIAAGDVGKSQFIKGKSAFKGRSSFDAIEELNDLYKEVKGRSFYTASDNSSGQDLYWRVLSMKKMQARVAQAEAGLSENKKIPTDYFKEAKKADEFHVKDYYSTEKEMGARAFEAYIFDKLKAQGRQSDYLVHGVENKYYEGLDIKPYPEGAERQAINKAFDALFENPKLMFGVAAERAEPKITAGLRDINRTQEGHAQIISDLADWLAPKIVNTAHNIARVTVDAVKTFGTKVKPFVRQAYEQAKSFFSSELGSAKASPGGPPIEDSAPKKEPSLERLAAAKKHAREIQMFDNNPSEWFGKRFLAGQYRLSPEGRHIFSGLFDEITQNVGGDTVKGVRQRLDELRASGDLSEKDHKVAHALTGMYEMAGKVLGGEYKDKPKQQMDDFIKMQQGFKKSGLDRTALGALMGYNNFSMLSGGATMGRPGISSVITGIAEMGARTAATPIDIIWNRKGGKRQVTGTTPGEFAGAVTRGAWEGVKDMAQTVKTGVSKIDATSHGQVVTYPEVETNRPSNWSSLSGIKNKGANALGMAENLTSRIHKGVHSPAYFMARAAAMEAGARLLVKDVAGKDKAAEMAHILENPPAELIYQADNAAMDATLYKKNALVQAWDGLLRKANESDSAIANAAGHAARFISPFARVGLNAAAKTADYHGLTLARHLAYDNWQAKNYEWGGTDKATFNKMTEKQKASFYRSTMDPAEQVKFDALPKEAQAKEIAKIPFKLSEARRAETVMAGGRAAMGALGMAAGALLQSMGMLGQEEADDKNKGEVGTDQLEGKRPGGIAIKGRNYDIGYLGHPLATTLFTGARIYDALKGKGKGSGLDQAADIAKQAAWSATKATPAGEYIKDIRDASKYGIGDVAARTALSPTRWIPGPIRDTTLATDRIKRKQSTIADSWKANIPGLSKTVTPKLDAAGRTIPQPWPYDPTRSTPLQPENKVYEEMDRVGLGIANSRKRPSESDDAYQKREQDQLEMFNRRATALMNTARYQAMSEDDQKQALGDLLKASRGQITRANPLPKQRFARQ